MALIASLLGGIGLFLLGMRMMTEGLKLAAGPALRDILSRSTATHLRGLLSGMLVTLAVQSSSAVIVALIGFVNAGLMNLRQAVTVVYGSNMGTTGTAWLVALVGFHIDIKVFALPAIGLGMLLRLIQPERRGGALGEALAGFGLFFLGIEILRSSFDGLGEDWQLAGPGGDGLMHLLLYVGAGILLTVLTQSSSATVAIVLTAAGGGLLTLPSAAAMVIGAHIGTTSTALLSVIGATPNAKRVAAAHVIFNLSTGVVALLLLSGLLALLAWTLGVLGLDTAPAAVLATFHTVFSLLGVLLLLPATGVLVRFLERRFVSTEEDRAQPRFLDRNVLATPTLALHALYNELRRIGDLATETATVAIREETTAARGVREHQRALEQLVLASGEFVIGMQSGRLPPEISTVLPNALRISRYYSEMVEAAERQTRVAEAAPARPPSELTAALLHFRRAMREFLALCHTRYETETTEAALLGLQREYQQIKAQLLHAGTAGQLPVRATVEQLDRLSDLRRMAEQAEKAARHMAALSALLQSEVPTDEPATEPAATHAANAPPPNLGGP